MTPCRRRHGFTLLELMVSMGVLAMLLVILLSIVDSATRMWRESENRVDSYREARAALNMIISDLKSIYVAPNPAYFKLPSGGEALRFVTRIPNEYQDDADKSELCEVGYERKYARVTTGGDETYNLYRSLWGSNRTFNDLTSGNLFSGGETEELLARNISEFRIEAFTIDPASGATTEFHQSASTPFPDIITVTLTALNQATAAKLKSRAQWSDTNSALYKENHRTFTARIRIETDPANFPRTTPTPTPSP